MKKIMIKVFTLFKKRSLKHCGNNLNIYGKVKFYNSQTISIGNDVKVNEGVKLLGREGSTITIGDRVTLSANVTVLSSEYDVKTWMNKGKKIHKHMETYIGDDVWICANSTILGGVKVTGKFVIIAAGSVVIYDITEDYCLYAGVPARLVKKYKNI